jgi:hypothetical protein
MIGSYTVSGVGNAPSSAAGSQGPASAPVNSVGAESVSPRSDDAVFSQLGQESGSQQSSYDPSATDSPVANTPFDYGLV